MAKNAHRKPNIAISYCNPSKWKQVLCVSGILFSSFKMICRLKKEKEKEKNKPGLPAWVSSAAGLHKNEATDFKAFSAGPLSPGRVEKERWHDRNSSLQKGQTRAMG